MRKLNLSPFSTPVLVSFTDNEKRIPVFLEESEHFLCVLLDIEGNVQDANQLFFRQSKTKTTNSIFDLIAPGNQSEMEELLERLLLNPKSKAHFLMKWEKGSLSDSIWWEFSMVVNQENDPVGFIGIGLPLRYLEEELPLEHLLDILDYGVIKIDSDLNILEADDLSKNILQIPSSSKQVLSLQSFICFLPEDLVKLNQWNGKDKFLQLEASTPACGEVRLTLFKQEKNISVLVGFNSSANIRKSSKTYVSQEALELIPGPVWVINDKLVLLQSNAKAIQITEDWVYRQPSFGVELNLGQRLGFYEKILNKINDVKGREENFFEWKINAAGSRELWQFRIKRLSTPNVFLVQGIDLSHIQKRVEHIQLENQQLKELVVQPSYILRSPLSSMLGLLDLIDSRKLDSENKKYFSYLRPLAEELDQVIRTNAKQVAAFD
ncbi:hypothetical protein E4S40_09665 [Algoriphagus kandeliae]|uniref:PAS domain-containing protein n=1 Tax=Algoriphagus kandeliae TaxID=2562278 RepID=A0A4Y9QT18_9BACT|nr:hypothetical protein [Algoriphagus kandeliae]TFV94293.1 hypothetical protein E4S40_09665 [Algoriphagus kandeliae]